MDNDQSNKIILKEYQEDVFDRQKRIAGWNQQSLGDAKILIIGAGALANECAKNLAMAGVGHLTFVDYDHVEVTNLNRCVFFSAEDLKQPKSEVLAERVKQQFPSTETTWFMCEIEKLDEYDIASADLVLSCVDNLDTRFTVSRLCIEYKLPLVDGGTEGLVGRVQSFLPGSTACLECGRIGMNSEMLSKRYQCGEKIEIYDRPMAAVSVASALVGAIQSSEAIKILQLRAITSVGYDESSSSLLTNKLFYMDLNSNYSSIMEIQRDSNCMSH